MSAQEEVYNLTKKSNFRPTLLEDMDILLISYITIVHHYVIFFFENKETIKPTIMNKGLTMLSHVFIILLHYSKNLNLTIHHCKTSIVYYVEYINQITDKDDNMFFNLSLKDAIIYVYTKSIYVVPEDIRKEHILTILEKQQLENIQDSILKYSHLLQNIIIFDSFQKSTLGIREKFLKELLETIKVGIIKLHSNTLFITQSIQDKIELCNSELVNNKAESIDFITDKIKSVFHA
tara:strand:+ start:227 stop:931 length:705 start_codon:yes stop_codon:yes gene_type:complete